MIVKDCKLIEKNLADFLDGKLSQELTARLSHHLDECPACRELVDSFASVWSSSETLEAADPSPDMWAAIQVRLDEIDEKAESKSFIGRFIPVLQPAAIAAAILVTALAGYGFGKINGSDSSTDTAIVNLWEEYGLDVFDQYPYGSVADSYLNVQADEGDES